MKKRNLILFAFFILSIPVSYAQVWDEIIKITPSDGGGGFGEKVAIDGDYAIVAAGNDNAYGTNSGSAYVFKLVDGVWGEVQKLNSYDASAGDWFGADVAISGDYALISATQNDDDGTNSGCAYIFKRSGEDIWVESQKLTASDAAGNDYFGGSVSIDGEYAVVAAENENGNTGAAYVFELNDVDEWVEVQKLTASDAAGSDGFGNATELLGDRLMIGARLQDFDVSNPNSGTAYLFERGVDGTWTESQQFFASDFASNDRFGRDVALSETSILIGAFYDDDAGSNSGSAYIFEEDEFGDWVETQKLTASDAAISDWFGRVVTISEDYAIITAPVDDDAGTSSGSAYVFEKDIDGIWTEIEKITASDAGANDWFGYSAEIDGNQLIMGARNTSAYIFGACSAMSVTVSSSEVCEGEEVTLDATSMADADIIWTEDIIDGEAFIPSVGVTTYIATGGEYDCELQVEITVHEAPTVEILVADSIVCDGDEITLSGDGAVSYVWEEDITDGEAFIPELGETTYTVTGTDDNDCENSASINILVNALPTVMATADDSTVCDGDEITLSGDGATTYVWDEGATDGVAFTPPLGETTYTVIGTDDNACENTASLTILVNPLPVVTASVDETLVCEGDEITLTGSGATTYLWDEGAVDGIAFEPTVGETTYTVTGTDDNGCSAMDATTVTVLAAPDVAIATLADDILCLGIDGVTLSGTPTDGTFSGTGMTGFQFDPNVAGIGSHTVYYTYENDEGCSATDSVLIQVVDCLGINDLNNLSFNIYPNPFTDFATIAFNQELTEAHQIIVYDVIGQEVYRKENITGSQIILTKEELGTGVYFISLSDNKNQVFTAKLIIQ